MISSLYQKLPKNSEKLLRNAVTKGLANGTGSAKIFFRADDIGVPGEQFSKLIQSFTANKLPLCLAVVPTWLTENRLATLQQDTDKGSTQWCWHQHGWRHRNYETEGKKQEFGSGRSPAAQVADLRKGKNRLEQILDDDFSLYFTPPWNRCSRDTLEGLQRLGFKAVSRSQNAKPTAPENFPDIQVNIDLHTRKETNQKKCMQDLLTEITQGIASGTGGIMIHHQRMNQAAFDFLALFLQIVASNPKLRPTLFHKAC